MLSQILAAVCIVLLGAAVGLGLAWRRAKLSAARNLDALRGAQIALRAARDAGDERASAVLDGFDEDRVYRLVAVGSCDVEGAPAAYGWVQDDSGALRPFALSHDIGGLAGGDCFSPIGGHLVKQPPEAFVVLAGELDLDEAEADDAPTAQAGTIEADHEVDTVLAPAKPVAGANESTRAGLIERMSRLDEEDADKTRLIPSEPTAAARPDPHRGLAYLKVVAGNDEGVQFFLPFDRATVGRDSRNTVPLNDTGASRVHCEITYDRSRFVLRDNDSTNGTLCNGEKVDFKPLEFGDTIKVADTEMVYTCAGFEKKDTDRAGAVRAFEETLEREPNFLTVLKLLAFLLESDVVRQKEAEPYWKRIMALEKRR